MQNPVVLVSKMSLPSGKSQLKFYIHFKTETSKEKLKVVCDETKQTTKR